MALPEELLEVCPRMDRDTDHLHGSEAFVPKHSKVQPYTAGGTGQYSKREFGYVCVFFRLG